MNFMHLVKCYAKNTSCLRAWHIVPDHILWWGGVTLSYKISYGKPMPVERPNKRMIWPLFLLLSLCALGVGFYVCSDALRPLTESLFPWTRPSVQKALSMLTDEIGNGIPVSDAVAAFCEEIVHGAG